MALYIIISNHRFTHKIKIVTFPKYLRNVLKEYNFNHNYRTRIKINFNVDYENKQKTAKISIFQRTYYFYFISWGIFLKNSCTAAIAGLLHPEHWYLLLQKFCLLNKVSIFFMQLFYYAKFIFSTLSVILLLFLKAFHWHVKSKRCFLLCLTSCTGWILFCSNLVEIFV